MPVKLTEAKQLFGEIINVETIETMVKAYRKENEGNPNALKYALFTVKEMFELLKVNGILQEKTVDAILDEHPAIDDETYGIKIYLGTHTSIDDCPGRNPSYLKKTAPIICTTIKEKNSQPAVINDMLKDEVNSVTYFGLDQTSLCPPDCGWDLTGNAVDDIAEN